MTMLRHIWWWCTKQHYRKLYKNLKHKPGLLRILMRKIELLGNITEGVKVKDFEVKDGYAILYISVKFTYPTFHTLPFFKVRSEWHNDEIMVNIKKELLANSLQGKKRREL